ncbi:MAG: DUF5985 family protein [Vicinamibacterales bacterium]
MAVTVYILCTLTSSLVALLLLREHWQTASRLLFWGAMSFVAMSASNALVLVDLVILPDVNLALVRASTFCLATVLFLVGIMKDVD